MRALMFLLACLFVGGFAADAFSQNIYIWDKDLGEIFLDPEGSGMVGCEYAIKQCLTANGYTFTSGTTLPGDLSPYDILFVVMGVFRKDS